MKTYVRPFDFPKSDLPLQPLGIDQLESTTVTSQSPTHPIENALKGLPGGWRASAGGPQVIHLRFNAPTQIRQVSLRFDIAESRTQEFTLKFSTDRGRTFSPIVRQQYNFSPETSAEEESYSLPKDAITDLELSIIPNISGGDAVASLAWFRFS